MLKLTKKAIRLGRTYGIDTECRWILLHGKIVNILLANILTSLIGQFVRPVGG